MVQKVLGNNNKTITVSSVNNGVVDDGNSSSNVLLAGVPFVGVGIAVTDFVEVIVSVFSDVASAVDGLSIQYSADNTNWDHTDEYSIPAGTGKNFSVQRVTGYFRIVYTNGAIDQTEFRLTSILNKVRGKPSSRRISDDITSEDDAELTTTVIKTVGSDPSTFHNVDVQHPLPNDGDSTYLKDIDVPNSDNGGFSGVITDYFDSLKSVNFDASVTNPKAIKVWFNRTASMHELGIGCDDLTKSFSNIKFKALGSGEEVRFTKDLSADNTKLNSFLLELPHLILNGFILEFHTVDEIGLSNLWMQKAIDTRASLLAVKPDGEIIDIGATSSGNLKTSDAENGLAIAKGEVTGSTFIHKFGNAPDFDTTDGIVTVWDGADDGGINAMHYTYSSTADIDSLSSNSALDTIQVEVQGLDSNYDLLIQTITLQGQTTVVLPTAFIRVFRIKNINSSDNVGYVYCYVNGTATTAGTPNVPANVRAVVQPGNNQTLMAIYTVPAGKTGYMRDWYANIAGANKTSNYPVEIRVRPFGQVFQLKHVSALAETGSSSIQHNYSEPEVFGEKTDVEIRVSASATGVTGTSISAGFDIVLVDNV
jgi:hypothetical protein